jgi:hypothetical protein
MIAATCLTSDPLFAAVFEPQDPIPPTRHLLKSDGDNDTSTIQPAFVTLNTDDPYLTLFVDDVIIGSC